MNRRTALVTACIWFNAAFAADAPRTSLPSVYIAGLPWPEVKGAIAGGTPTRDSIATGAGDLAIPRHFAGAGKDGLPPPSLDSTGMQWGEAPAAPDPHVFVNASSLCRKCNRSREVSGVSVSLWVALTNALETRNDL
jgi:hypothetical protein